MKEVLTNVGAAIIHVRKHRMADTDDLQLVRMVPADLDTDSGYAPATSISVWGADYVAKLRDALSDALGGVK